MLDWAAALGLLLVGWLITGLTFTGIGRLIAPEPEPLGTSFWTGLALVLIAVQAWHLVLPLGWPASAAAVAVAAVGWVRSRSGSRPTLGTDRWSGCAIAVMGGLIALRALGGVRNADTGMYHLQAVRWAQAYAVVPGLVNIHPFLKVNHGALLLHALVDHLSPGLGPAHGLNGLLALAWVAWIVRSVRAALTGAGTPADVFNVMLLPWSFFVAGSPDLTSASSDLAELVLGAVLTSTWVELTFGARSAAAVRRVVLLAVALAVVKLSSVIAAGVMVLTALAWGRTVRAWMLVVPVAAAAWAAGAIIRAGVLPYPGALVVLDVDWRAPRPLLDAIRDWTLAYGRGGLHASGWSWLPGKLEQLWTSLEEFRDPLVLALVASVAAAAVPGARREWRSMTIAAIPVAAQVAFWLGTSPKLRYAGSWLQALPAVLAAGVFPLLGPRARTRALAAVFVLAGVRTVWLAGEQGLWVPARPEVDVPPVEGRWVNTDAGARLFVPEAGDLCWDAPLPCTPYPDPALAPRAPDTPGAGYRYEADLDRYSPASLRCCVIP